MAANIFTGATNSNWGTATNWSLGVIPVTGDGNIATFDATSPNCSMNSTNRTCNGIDTTGYTNTITMTQALSVIAGNIVIGATTNFAGANTLSISGTGVTITTNGVVIPYFQFYGTNTSFTLVDDLNCSRLLFSGSTTNTINGNNIYCTGNINFNNANYNIVGTTTLHVTGTCIWTHASSSYVGLNVVFNTASTITFSANGFRLRNPCTFTYIAGTVSGTLNLILFSGSVSMDSGPIVWDTMTVAGVSTLVLLSDISFSGQFVTNSGITVTGAYTCYVAGNFRRVGNVSCSFTSTLIFNGNTTWTDLYPSQSFQFNDMQIAGDLTISGSVSFRGSMTYVSGITETTGSTLSIGNGATTLDINSDTSSQSTYNTTGINLNNLTVTYGIAITLPSDIRVCGNLQVTGNTFTNAKKVYVAGDYYVSSNTGSGTYTIVMDGTGRWWGTAGVRNNLVIDTLGVITINSQIGFSGYASATLTYLNGTVNTAGSTLVVAIGAANFNTNGIDWNDVTITVSATIYLYSTFTVTGTLAIRQTTNFFGTAGFIASTLSLENFNKNLQLTAGITYAVNNSFSCIGTAYAQIWTIYSSSSSYAYLNLQYGASQDVRYCGATWINSSGGQTIYSSSGSLVSTVNWLIGVAPTSSGNMLLMF